MYITEKKKTAVLNTSAGHVTYQREDGVMTL